MQVVYGDILFLINFSMDFLCLYITGKALHHKINPLALIVSSGLGAIYALAVLFWQGNAFISSAIRLCAAALICYISFGVKGKNLMKTLLLFYSASFLLGGVITAVYHTVAKGSQKVYIGGQIKDIYPGIPAYVFILISVGAGIFSVICAKIFSARRAREPVSVSIYGEGTSVSFESLCDTGNLLRDPYNGLPVIVVGYMSVMPILPYDIHELFRQGDYTKLDKVSPKISHRVHLFPVKSATGGSLMLAYRPDRICVNGSNKDACIGIIPTKKESDFGGYPSITPQILC